MFDIGWSELLLIAFIAIVVVGPKDLPKLMAQAGRWSRAAQRAAREFQASLEQLAEEADTKEVTRDLRALGREAQQTFSAHVQPDPYPQNPTGPAAAPPLSVLPPEGGSFRPPAEDEDFVADAAALKSRAPNTGSGHDRG